jgi:hypothetical protein
MVAETMRDNAAARAPGACSVTTEEMIRRYRDMLGQYDRTVLHDDDEAAQRLAEVSDTLIGHARLLIERLLPGASA